MDRAYHHLRAAALGLLFALLAADPAHSAEPPDPATPVPTVEQRVREIEDYFGHPDPTVPHSDSLPHAPTRLPAGFWLRSAAWLLALMVIPAAGASLVQRRFLWKLMAQSAGASLLVAVLWWMVGYSLAFGRSFANPVLGGTEHFFLGVGSSHDSGPNRDYVLWLPEIVFALGQLHIALLPVLLLAGALWGRLRTTRTLLFLLLWSALIYLPLAHMVWSADGLMNGFWNPQARVPVLDLWGGFPVHLAAGTSALVLAAIFPHRVADRRAGLTPAHGFYTLLALVLVWMDVAGVPAEPTSPRLTMVLAGAILSSGAVWALLESRFRRLPSLPGLCTGVVISLVALAPAAGVVTPWSGVVLAATATVAVWLTLQRLRLNRGHDEALDAFAVHGIGGLVGVLLTGVLASAEVNPNLAPTSPSNLLPSTVNGVAAAVTAHTQATSQWEAALIVIALSAAATAFLAMIIKLAGPAPKPHLTPEPEPPTL